MSNKIITVASANMGKGLVWNKETRAWDVVSSLNDLLSDVRLSAITSNPQINEGEISKVIFTVSNVGAVSCAGATLRVNLPDGISFKEEIQKPNQTTTTKISKGFEIKNLGVNEQVTVTYTGTFNNYGSYPFSGSVEVQDTASDKHTGHNTAGLQIDVTTTRDVSYQASQDCPALDVRDVETGRSLLLMDYSTATYYVNGSVDSYCQETGLGGATLHRLNVYSPSTKKIQLKVDNAGSVIVNGYDLDVTDKGVFEAVTNRPDGTYFVTSLTDHSTCYEIKDKRYLVKPYVSEAIVSGGTTNVTEFYLTNGITKEKTGVHNTQPKYIKSSFSNGLLVLDNLKPGTFLGVSFKPGGKNCQWQTVWISVPVDVTSFVKHSTRVTLKEGDASRVQYVVDTRPKTEGVKGYNNINGDLSPSAIVVKADEKRTEKVTIIPVAGKYNKFVFDVKDGKINPLTTTQGNVKITPSDDGSKVTVEIMASATSSDNFTYRNSGVVIDISIS